MRSSTNITVVGAAAVGCAVLGPFEAELGRLLRDRRPVHVDGRGVFEELLLDAVAVARDTCVLPLTP